MIRGPRVHGRLRVDGIDITPATDAVEPALVGAAGGLGARTEVYAHQALLGYQAGLCLAIDLAGVVPVKAQQLVLDS